MPTDNYTVRVLRREQTQQDRSAHLDGVVEAVDSGTRQAFHSARELWAILAGAGGGSQPDEDAVTTKTNK